MSLDLLGKFRYYAESFKQSFVERDEEIDALFYGVLAKEHILFRGKPGTAKSMLTKSFFKGIQNSKVFSIQLTAFMDESYLFGPLSIQELKQGVVKHNTVNSLVDCDFAFIDEAFNASDETLSSMNEVLNERLFTRNNQKEDCGLLSAVLTTNQSREDEEKLKPIYDRILFNIEVKGLSKSGRRVLYNRYITSSFNGGKTIFTLEDIRKIQEFIDTEEVTFSDDLLTAFDELLTDYKNKITSHHISDRRMLKCLKVLKIVALSHGRAVVDLNDLDILRLIVCSGDEDRLVFDEVLAKVKASMISRFQNWNEFIRLKNIVISTVNADTTDLDLKKRTLETLHDNIKIFDKKVPAKDLKKLSQTIQDAISNPEKINVLPGSGQSMSSILKGLELNPIGTEGVYKSTAADSLLCINEAGIIVSGKITTDIVQYSDGARTNKKQDKSLEELKDSLETSATKIHSKISNIFDSWRGDKVEVEGDPVTSQKEDKEEE